MFVRSGVLRVYMDLIRGSRECSLHLNLFLENVERVTQS